MKKYLLMMLSALVMSTAWAQDRTITGKVTDAESGETIPGANIVEKGTSNGTITDFDGNYRLSVGDGAVLLVSFVGYQTTEIAVGARSTVDIALELDVQALSEVVVIGYGTQTKKEITSAVTSVGAEDFNNGNITSAGQLLQGKVAGLSIVLPGGDPNQDQQIRLRGLTTFGANTQPLIVLDGVVGASLDNVDPNDIASMDVLKDGSAAAIYGARGSSGVILVTTKSGKGAGASTSVNYNGFVTIDQVANKIDVLSPEEFVARGGTDFGSETDWFEELTQTAVSQTHNLSVSGALSPKTSYRASVNYRDNQGIVKGVNFDRLNTRLNIDHAAINGRLRMQFNVAANNRNQESINLSAFRYAVIYNPTAPIFDDLQSNLDGGYFQRDLFDFNNPIALSKQQTFINERKSVLTNFRTEFDIIDQLTVAVNYAQDIQTGIDGAYWSKFDQVIGRGANGTARRTTFDNLSQLAEATVNYNNTFGDINFSALLGVATQVRTNEGFGAQSRQFLFDDQSFNSLGFGGIRIGNNTDMYSYKSKDILNSAFARVNATYNNAVFLSASVRREAYSGFGENNKAGFFPAASAGVELTEFIDMGPVNSLKMRASFGITGNLPPDPYLALPIFGPGARIDVDGDPLSTGDVYVAPSQQQNPNPELKWETKQEVNVGLDFAISGGKITGSIDAYRRNISDLLFRVNVPIGAPNPFLPGTTNTVGGTWANVADLSAGGLEFVASYNGLAFGDFVWTPSINFTLYDKTVIDNFQVKDIETSEIRLATPGSPGQNNNEIIRNKVGETIGNMYGPKFLGLNELGEYILQDATNPDAWGVIGNGLPDGEFGFNNSFVYKSFDFNFFLRGAFGHDLYNSYRGFYENRDASSNTWNSVVTDKTPVVTSPPTFSDLYVEKATFVRLDNAQFGYKVPVKSNVISNFRVYVAGQNLFTITNYTGIDPEVRYNDTENGDGFTTNLAPGIERRNTYFTTRSVTIGVNITFK
jgi:TonB-linked SusC/RagA family outer membrane protein